jgi:anti-sigma B factor antagonist
MQADVRRVKNVPVIHVTGTMSTQDTWGQLKEAVAVLVGQGERNVILNLSQLSYVDGSFIGELVACSLVLARAGGTLRLASTSRRVNELLLITRLGQIFDSYETDAEAIASVVPDTAQNH